jgi:hypothetical protein
MLFGRGRRAPTCSPRPPCSWGSSELGMPARACSSKLGRDDRPPPRHPARHRSDRLAASRTTLYASLNRIVSDEIKVITVEDPVEYHVSRREPDPGPTTRSGSTFAAGLRAILRHDPDVVMIGEIRDKETAETAVQASLTGHLVFSTLHTNDAAERRHAPARHGSRALPRQRRPSRASWPSASFGASARSAPPTFVPRARRPAAASSSSPRAAI